MGKPKVFTMKGQIALSRTRKVKNLSRQRNTSKKKIYGISGITIKMNIIITTGRVDYPKAEADFVTQNLRPAAKMFTGAPYLSWGSGSP